jgi:hypothetical protein
MNRLNGRNGSLDSETNGKTQLISWQQQISKKRKKNGKTMKEKNVHSALHQLLEKKLEHYYRLTMLALQKIELQKGLSEKEQKNAEDFLQMAKNYFSDANHFRQKGELLTALAAYSYAHAWLDAGVRAQLLNGKGDDKLFVLP